MADFGAMIYIFVALTLWFGVMHFPSLIVIFFTHKNYSILLSGDYWVVVAASCLPSIIGLVLFVAIYPLFKAPGEGAMAGLWFVFTGALMMSIGTAKFAYQYPNIGGPVFWDTFKFGCWPYLIAIALYCLILPVALFFKLRSGE